MRNFWDIDCETASPLDIQAVGGYEYAAQARFLLEAVSENGGDVLVWDAYNPDTEESVAALAALRRAFAGPGELWAHNAPFEAAMHHYQAEATFGCAPIDVQRWRCSAVLARSAGLPSSLEHASAAVRRGVSAKDADGAALIDLFCIPRADGEFNRPDSPPPPWLSKHLTLKQPELPGHLFQWLYEEQPSDARVFDALTPYFSNPSAKRLAKVAEMARKHAYEFGSSRGKVTLPSGAVVSVRDAWSRFREYCRKDVLAQMELRRKLRSFELGGEILESWKADLVINQRGVPIDRDAVSAARGVLADADAVAFAEFHALTGLNVGQAVALKTWCESRGYRGANMAAPTVEAEVERLRNDPNADATLLRALEIKTKTAFASLKKLPTAELMSRHDGRARGCTKFFGAKTARDSGVGLQVQNMRRPDDTDRTASTIGVLRAGADFATFRVLGEFEPHFSDPHEAIANAIRHIIRDPDYPTLSIDFANIEARGTAWLVGDEPLLELYANDVDMYAHMGSSISKDMDDFRTREWIAENKKVEKYAAFLRQLGKVAELACGFRGGRKAVETFAQAFRVKLTPGMADRIVQAFRKSRPKYVEAWTALERCAVSAIRSGGTHTHERLSFRMRREGDLTWLSMRLPSGREINYFNPRERWCVFTYDNGDLRSIQELDHVPTENERTRLRELSPRDRARVETERAEDTSGDYRPSVYKAVRSTLQYQSPSKTGKLQWETTHGGVLLENASQATAGDFLHFAVPNLIKEGFEIYMKVHDEVVGTIKPGQSAEHFAEIMAQRPQWALEFPLAAAADETPYYSKS
jgi:DNA polymerase bacteriophage-type